MSKKRYSAVYDSPVGRLTIVTDGKALTAILLEKETESVDPEIWDTDLPAEACEIIDFTRRWLDRYFAGEAMPNPRIGEDGRSYTLGFEDSTGFITLVPDWGSDSSDFRRQVWRMLCDIPYGETITYGDIAGEMGRMRGVKKMAAQAVGGAVGKNPISIVIPCHRVIGAGGKLTGYGGGIPVKTWLLEHEGSLPGERRK